MNSHFEWALAIVYGAIEELNDLRPPDRALPIRPDVPLAGEGGSLDSLEIMTLALAIERGMTAATGREIPLLDAAELDLQLPAFRTPSSLASLVLSKSTP